MPISAFEFRALRSTGRRGITLIELLVVMTIISIVTAASIPLLSTGADTRRIREAARLVSSYISAAKSRAIETGRPAGIMIQRYSGTSSYATALVGVEVPPPYAGDTTTSTVSINSSGQLSGFPSGDAAWQPLVHVGDLIRLGYQGRSYMLLGNSIIPASGSLPTFNTTSNTNIGGQLLSATGFPGTACNLWAIDGSLALPALPVAPVPSVNMPFQILRQPIKSAVQPLQMPGDTVIDLYSTPYTNPATGNVAYTGASGIGTFSIPTTPITWVTSAFTNAFPYPNPIIMFGPTGGVGLVYSGANPPQHLQSAFYMLIGRREGMEDLGLSGTNLTHHSSMWVAISPGSGNVVTAENMAGTLPNARQFAQAAASIGGR